MSEISQYLEKYTPEYLLAQALESVPDDIDKREGAIIYDTLSIFCAKIADVFDEIAQQIDQDYIITATRKMNIAYRVAERGITWREATKSRRLGVFTYLDNTPAVVPINALFSTITDDKDDVVMYKVVEPYQTDSGTIKGSYVLECQTEGTIGNTYFGEILPISDMDTLGSATLTTVLVPARDEETIESVKQRYFDTFNADAFGGNISDYRKYMQENFTGVGQVQIYPRTQVNEKIVLSCVDPSNQSISQEYQNEIQQTLDPENYYNNGNNTEGMGLGVVPIGHKVIVMTPTEQYVDIELTQVIFVPGADVETVIYNIKLNISEYIKQVQNQWSSGQGEYSITIYHNRVLSAAINTDGIRNIGKCIINGKEEDLILAQTRDSQLMPKLNNVIVEETV